MDTETPVERFVKATNHTYRHRLLIALQDGDPQYDQDLQGSIKALRQSSDLGNSYGSIQLELYHNHLPKLSNIGVITWDKESGKISKGPRWDEIEPFLTPLHYPEGQFERLGRGSSVAGPRSIRE